MGNFCYNAIDLTSLLIEINTYGVKENRIMFKKDFHWGVATASYQIEGAAFEDGRSSSVWDDFSHTFGKTFNGHTGDVACDHYHRYEEDLTLMKELGVNSYRFSISWTRIMPDGTGKVNQKGVDFYNRLIDSMLEKGITPFITLFHWDYPSTLERMGGWLNPDSPKWFESYARTVFELFSDRVKNYMTVNEPQCFIGLGYSSGVHAPGLRRTSADIIRMAHNVLLAHGLAVKALREISPDSSIGFASNMTSAIPLTDSPEDIEAAREQQFQCTPGGFAWKASWWSDPIFFGKYPDSPALDSLGKFLPDTLDDDMKIISAPIDFCGTNIYQGCLCKAGKNGPELVQNPINTAKNACNWPIMPEALYWGPKHLYDRYHKPIVITENGMSCHDVVSLDGKVHDPNRIDFTHRYLKALKRATEKGVEVDGYFHWSFLDNFEWAEGYNERFGLVYVNYETLERIKKDSFEWYKNVIATNGEII